MPGLSSTLQNGLLTSVVVGRIEPGENASRLTGAWNERFVETIVPALPNIGAARRWMKTVKRVSRVEIFISRSGVSAMAEGVGHRLPYRRRVPLGVALGLGELGIPVFWHEDES